MPVVVMRPGADRFASDAIDVALVNNMPDGALRESERQFVALLEAGANDATVNVRRYALPGISRSPEAQVYLRENYFPISHLFSERPPTAVIVTGCEPRATRVVDEPYFVDLVQLVAWIQSNVSSALMSCLAAHVALWSFSRVNRVRLPEKHSGLFWQEVHPGHRLTEGLDPVVMVPHSRWNDMPIGAVSAAGGELLVGSSSTDWTLASVKRGICQFILMQGHLEYDAETLLREYRRDVRRWLHGDQAAYPTMPCNYFAPGEIERLEGFRLLATSGDRDPSLMEAFPYKDVLSRLGKPWATTAARFTENWKEEMLGRYAGHV